MKFFNAWWSLKVLRERLRPAIIYIPTYVRGYVRALRIRLIKHRQILPQIFAGIYKYNISTKLLFSTVKGFDSLLAQSANISIGLIIYFDLRLNAPLIRNKFDLITVP